MEIEAREASAANTLMWPTRSKRMGMIIASQLHKLRHIQILRYGLIQYKWLQKNQAAKLHTIQQT